MGQKIVDLHRFELQILSKKRHIWARGLYYTFRHRDQPSEVILALITVVFVEIRCLLLLYSLKKNHIWSPSANYKDGQVNVILKI